MINRNVAHLDKMLLFSCSWQKVDIQVGKYSKCVTIIPDDLTGITYWFFFSYWHTNNPPNDCDGGEKNPYSVWQLIKGTSVWFLRMIPINVHKHECSLNGTLRNIVERDISITWPLVRRSPSLPFRIYTLINLNEIKMPNIFKWIISFCGMAS